MPGRFKPPGLYESVRGLCTATLTANLCDWCDLGERSF
ncbi:hypothetical protein AP02_04085, partial [Mycobacterium tuberculosis M2352]